MDEGWTRYVLDTFGWEPITIHPEDVRDQRRLRRTYDVILFPSVNTRSVVEGLGGAGGGRGGGGRPVPPQYQGGIGETGLAALKEFVADGGTLVALGGGAGMLIEQFELPFVDGREGIERGVFNCPGSILEIQVDPANPIAWGMPQRAGIMFSNDATLTLPEGISGVDGAAVAAWFGDEDPLLSGFIQGPEHLFGDIGAVSMKQGNGTLVLFPLQVQRRAQTHATFKLLFNSLMNSVMR